MNNITKLNRIGILSNLKQGSSVLASLRRRLLSEETPENADTTQKPAKLGYKAFSEKIETQLREEVKPKEELTFAALLRNSNFMDVIISCESFLVIV